MFYYCSNILQQYNIVNQHIIWYKYCLNFFFSFDGRGKSLAEANHWSDKDVFGTRAFFRTVTDPAQLVIEQVALKDGGMYRCRVDFRNAQTRSVYYNLTVIGK